MLYQALEAAEVLAREDGVETEVVDLRSLLPLDKDAILGSAKKTGKVLVVHEDTRTGGIAGEIAAIINEEVFEYLDGPVLRVTAPDTPVPYSPPLEEFFLPNKQKILKAARQLAAY
jgi:2-oxoisovalerate dehydrogenase E1 component beta subunit